MYESVSQCQVSRHYDNDTATLRKIHEWKKSYFSQCRSDSVVVSCLSVAVSRHWKVYVSRMQYVDVVRCIHCICTQYQYNYFLFSGQGQNDGGKNLRQTLSQGCIYWPCPCKTIVLHRHKLQFIYFNILCGIRIQNAKCMYVVM